MNSLLILRYSAVVILITLLISCGGNPDKVKQLKTLRSQQADLTKKIDALEKELSKTNPQVSTEKMKEVDVTGLTTRSFDHYMETQGSIVALNNIQLSAKAAGVVTQVFVKEGDAVSTGQVLAQIDNSIIINNIAELKSNLELANTVYDRQKNLWAQKIGTEIQFLQSKNNKEGLERRLATLQEQNNMTRVKSPITGTVDAVNIKVGENAAPGIPLFRVINTNDLKVSAKVSESFITIIKSGNKVNVLFPDLNKSMDARVTFVGRNIDPLTRSFPLEVKLPPTSYLRPNMTAVIRVIFETNPRALCVPVNVVQDVDGQKIVYIAEKDGANTIARKKIVEVVGVYNNLAQIKTGLKVGDQIITVGYQGLNDGELIKI